MEAVVILISTIFFIVGGMIYFHFEDKRYWKNYWTEFKKRDNENAERFLREAEEYVRKQKSP